MKIINNIKNSDGFAKYANNALWLFIEQFLRIFLGLFVGIWIARHLGVELFGEYSYVLTLAAILLGIARLGIDAILFRELVSKPNMQAIYLGTVFWIRIFIAIGILTVSIIIFYSRIDVEEKIYICIISGSLLFQSFDVIEQYFLSRVFAKKISIIKIIQLLISAALKIYGIITNSPLLYFIVIFSFDSIIYALILVSAYKKINGLDFIKKYDRTIAKKILLESYPLFLSVIVVLLYQRFDYILIGKLIDNYSIGIYAAALKFTDSFYFIPTLLVSLFTVPLVNAKNKSYYLYNKRLRALFWLVILITSLIAISVYCLSNFLINTFYGKSYIESIKILQFHVITIVFMGVGIFTTKWHIIENRTKIVFYNTAVGATLSVIGNVLFIPIFGLKSAVITSVISHFMADIAMNFFWKETRLRFSILFNPRFILK